MKGILVKHTHRGIGKVEDVQGPYLNVLFLETGEKAVFEQDAFKEKELKFYRLPIKSICDSNGKPCIVEKALTKDKSTSLRSYLVTFTDDGLQAEVTEIYCYRQDYSHHKVSLKNSRTRTLEAMHCSLLAKTYLQPFKSNSRTEMVYERCFQVESILGLTRPTSLELSYSMNQGDIYWLTKLVWVRQSKQVSSFMICLLASLMLAY